MNQRSPAARPESALIVGGAGFIGSHIVDRLLSDGVRVDVVDDLSSGSLANLAAARGNASEGALRIHTLDVTIPEFVDVVRRRQPEVIYLTAVLTSSTQNSAGYVKSFAMAVATFEAAVSAGVKKIVLTLPANVLYGEVPARDIPIKEDRDKQPVGLAGVTAVSLLELCELYRRDHALEFTVLALATVYGPRQAPDNNVIPVFLAAHSSLTSAVIHGDGKQTRDFIYIDDVADAASRASSKGGGLLLHIGTGQQTSIKEVWSLISGATPGRATSGLATPSLAAAKRPHSLQRFALSSSRARLHLGWSSWTTIADGLASMLETND